MYAIIRTGGHQEKVTVGEQITVDRLKEEPGEKVQFVPLMVAKDDGSIVSDHKELSEEASVTGTVLQHLKGDKLDVFQYRQKTGYRRHTGHRQALTLVEISELRLGQAVETAEEKRGAEDAQRQALELERQARAEAEAAAPKKVTPKKKAPAKAGAKASASKAAKGAKRPAKPKAGGAAKKTAKPDKG
jgi:large subunit ribosomal protein L21